MLAFTTPAAGVALADLETVKRALDIADGTADDRLADLIDAASARINQLTARDLANGFGKASFAETFRLGAAQGRPLWLRHWPVTAIASVVEDGVALAAADYELEAGRKLWRLDGADARSTWPAAKIVVAGVGGFALPSGAPKDLAALCVSLVKTAWFAGQRDPLLRSEDVVGVYSASYAVPGAVGGLAGAIPGLTDEQTETINHWRNFTFG